MSMRTLPLGSMWAYMAGVQFGFAKDWMSAARETTAPNIRAARVRCARQANHTSIRYLKLARQAFDK